MTLRFALQLLVVVEGESVEDGVLLLVHRCHGALAVDLVDVDLLLPLQHRVPPNLRGLAERQLEAEHERRELKKKLLIFRSLFMQTELQRVGTHDHAAPGLQAPQGVLGVDLVGEFSLHQSFLLGSLLHAHFNAAGLQADADLRNRI